MLLVVRLRALLVRNAVLQINKDETNDRIDLFVSPSNRLPNFQETDIHYLPFGFLNLIVHIAGGLDNFVDHWREYNDPEVREAD